MSGKKLLILAAAALLAAGNVWACTSAIVSAKAAKNGRPLLWKHRDTSAENNFVERMPAQNGDLAYVALYNAGDSTLSEAWMGMNEAGFAIMNTASYNLAPDTAKFMDQEGVVMALALKKCRTLSDFETLLDTLPKPMGVQANFGLIDAAGEGAYYETDDYSYTKFSLADAPGGVLVRTNYSYSGAPDKGYGYIREENAKELLAPYIKGDSITPSTFTEGISQCFYHSLLGEDLTEGNGEWIIDQDFIPRNISSASIVIEGVEPGEDPRLSIMWTEIGYPPCSYVLPVTVDSVPEELRPIGPNGHSPLCDWVVERKHQVFPIERGSGKSYIFLPALKGYLQEGRAKSMENYRQGYLQRQKRAKSLEK